ncbi:hypothetical protein KN519_18540, partial [Acinetobacter baumannii]|uniref:hypothetical protein n=1 Tax=Acinetobacter baumannii TaxID=470 RepID=UPI001C05EC3D
MRIVLVVVMMIGSLMHFESAHAKWFIYAGAKASDYVNYCMESGAGGAYKCIPATPTAWQYSAWVQLPTWHEPSECAMGKSAQADFLPLE